MAAADLVGLDAPCQTLPPGASFSAAVFISHWCKPLGAGELRWKLDFVDRFGEHTTVQDGGLPAEPVRFSVTELDTLEVVLPDESGLATLALDGAGSFHIRFTVPGEWEARDGLSVYGGLLRSAGSSGGFALDGET